VTRLAAVIAALRASRGACAACGDAYEPHRHYRAGWECAACDDCPRYRPLPLRQRIADAVTASRGPDPVEQAIDAVAGAGGPSETEIKRMTDDYYRQNGGGRA